MRFLIVVSLALLAVGATADSNPNGEVPTDKSSPGAKSPDENPTEEKPAANSPSGGKSADANPIEDGPNANISSGSDGPNELYNMLVAQLIIQRLRALSEHLRSYNHRYNGRETYAPQYPWTQQGREPYVDPSFSRPMVPGVYPPLGGVNVVPIDAGGPIVRAPIPDGNSMPMGNMRGMPMGNMRRMPMRNMGPMPIPMGDMGMAPAGQNEGVVNA